MPWNYGGTGMSTDPTDASMLSMSQTWELADELGLVADAIPQFLDQTPPVPNYVSETVTKVSLQAGFSSDTVTFTANKDFQQFRIEEVTDATDAVFSGTLLASGSAGYSAGTPYAAAVAGASLVGADGAKTLKIFVQDYAGNWST